VGDSIGDRAWLDANTNGLQDANEQGVANIKVVLYNSSIVAVDSIITNADGYWFIKKIPAATGYFVIFFGKASGHYWTNAHIGDAAGAIKTSGVQDSDTDSDANPDGVTLQLDVAATMTDFKIDAGLSTNNILLSAKITKFIAKPIHYTVHSSIGIFCNGCIGW
jgi:hypothetical protein